MRAPAAWGSRLAKLAGPPLKPRRAVRADSLERREEKLIVGYVSPDMYTHSVSYFAASDLAAEERVRASCTTCPSFATSRRNA